MVARGLSAVLLAASIGATLHAGGGFTFQAVKTELTVGNPMIKGTGPYTVTINGTVSLSNAEKGFTGASATIKKQVLLGDTYVAFVNLPNGPPVPGMPAKPVVFTFTVPSKATYGGSAKMQYLDGNGAAAEIQAPIANFTIN